jgi:hypothetical protein
VETIRRTDPVDTTALGRLVEKSFTTTPARILGDGDDVVMITKTTAGGESAWQADVLTYRSGKRERC